MAIAILDLIDVALKIWLFKLKNKYVQQSADLRKAYYEESNKPRGVIDDAVMCNLEEAIKQLAITIAEQMKLNPQ